MRLGEEGETIYKRARRMPCIIEEHTGVFTRVYDVLLTVEENVTRAELRVEG